MSSGVERARFLLDIIGAIRKEAGHDFHLQVKISAVEDDNAVMFWQKRGNTLDESRRSGAHAFRNYLLFRYRPPRPIFRFLWNRAKGEMIEGINVRAARAIKQSVAIPVLCTGGFQRASPIENIIADGFCDGVSTSCQRKEKGLHDR